MEEMEIPYTPAELMASLAFIRKIENQRKLFEEEEKKKSILKATELGKEEFERELENLREDYSKKLNNFKILSEEKHEEELRNFKTECEQKLETRKELINHHMEQDIEKLETQCKNDFERHTKKLRLKLKQDKKTLEAQCKKELEKYEEELHKKLDQDKNQIDTEKWNFYRGIFQKNQKEFDLYHTEQQKRFLTSQDLVVSLSLGVDSSNSNPTNSGGDERQQSPGNLAAQTGRNRPRRVMTPTLKVLEMDVPASRKRKPESEAAKKSVTKALKRNRK